MIHGSLRFELDEIANMWYLLVDRIWIRQIISHFCVASIPP